MQQRQRPEAAQRQQKQAGQQAVTILAAPQSQILQQAQGDGCWVARYRDPNFAGQPVIIDGPISLSNVRDHVNTGWFRSFGSMQVGEKAKVTIYSDQNVENRRPMSSTVNRSPACRKARVLREHRVAARAVLAEPAATGSRKLSE